MKSLDNTQKVLTIYIPTYNRKEQLKACLDHICPQINDEVVLVVRDNNSNSFDCESFCSEYVKRFGIIYQRNVVNVGMECNIAKGFEFCETKWLWVVGDDDWVIEGAVSHVLQTIKKHESAVFIKFNSSFSGVVEGIDSFCEVMKTPYEFTNSYFISEGVHNIGLTKNEMFWHYKYLSTNIGQILRVIKHLLLNNKSRCVFLADPILLEHGDNISWSHFDLVYSFLALFDYFKDQRHIFKDNIFKCIFKVGLSYIQESSISKKEKLHYAFLLKYKYGFFNSWTLGIRSLGAFYISLLRK